MKSRSGLTIVEIILIVAVISVVAAITVPKFRTMLHASREGRTKARLGDLRGAVAIYYSDNFGLYPSDEGSPETRLSQHLVPRYIKRMPSVELTHYHPQQRNTVQDRFNDEGDWMYTTLNGFVAVNCTHPDTKGEAISSW